MNDKIEVMKLILTLPGGLKVELTPEQARAAYDQLSGLFQAEQRPLVSEFLKKLSEQKTEHHHHHYSPAPIIISPPLAPSPAIPEYPGTPFPTGPGWPLLGTIWCSSDQSLTIGVTTHVHNG